MKKGQQNQKLVQKLPCFQLTNVQHTNTAGWSFCLYKYQKIKSTTRDPEGLQFNHGCYLGMSGQING